MSLSLVTIIWSMVASACLMLMVLNLLIWRENRQWSNLLFSVMALAITTQAFFELWLMKSQTPEEMIMVVRWGNVSIWVLIVSLVGFVLLHLQAGRVWLAGVIVALRTFSLLLNFLIGQNLNYLEITRVRHTRFLGETISIVAGVQNPWMIIGQLSVVLLVVFAVDATISVWRRGNKQLALISGGSIIVFVLAAIIHSALVLWGIITWPIMTSFFFMVMIAGMAYELSLEVIRSAQLTDDLRESGARMQQAAQAAEFGSFHYDFATRQAFFSPEFLALWGLPQSATPGFASDMVTKTLHPDDKANFLPSMQVAIDPCGPGIFDLAFRIFRQDGQLRWLRARGRTVFKGDGPERRPLHSSGIIQDITDYKQLEEQLRQSLQEVQQLRDRLQMENVYLREEVKLLYKHTEIVGDSESIRDVLAKAEQVSATDSTVLILGETGTGKELLARAIHDMSRRKNRMLVVVNCASLPPTLIESELFGREKGAYTGSLTRMAGRFELADGSTLFLDEIGELPLELQSKLLRVLEHGEFERLGSNRTIKVNVRLIAATNRDLTREINEGRFRKDLYYRLNVFPITVPPLRDRKEDIPQLVWHFIRQFEKPLGKHIDSIPRKNMEALKCNRLSSPYLRYLSYEL